MHVQGRRGRACQACRRRKIKCGEQTPTCQQCNTSRIECSGPITGPIIVEVNPQRGRRQYRQGERKHLGKDKAAVTREDPASPASPAGSSPPPVAHPGQGSKSDPGSPSLVEISVDQVVFNALASKFQESVWVPHQRYDSVVSHLLDFVRSGHLPNLQMSIGAVALAMSGIATENRALLLEGQRLYGAALNALIRGMPRECGQGSAASETQQVEPISIETMAISVVCVWYEVISSSTNPQGWIEHSWGLGRLILSRPPEDYAVGLAHAVFRTARYMVANASFAAISPTPLALDLWLYMPFSSHPKEPFDRLVDFMLVIPVCLSLVDQLCATGQPIPASDEVENLRQNVMQLDQQLTLWWIEYQERFTRSGQRVYLDIEAEFEDASGTYHPANRRFQTDDAYESVAHYATNHLVVSLMNANLVSPSDRPIFRAQALTYSSLALSATSFADAQSTTEGIREYFGMIVQHVVMFCATPSRSHQAYVKRRIDNWADPDGFRGVCGAEEAMMERWSNLAAVWNDLE